VRIAIAADHGGASLRDTMAEAVRAAGHEPVVLGAELNRPDDDYPVFARLVGRALASGRAERAVLLCGSGACLAGIFPDRAAAERAAERLAAPGFRAVATPAAARREPPDPPIGDH
jgi:ribose 5-phosphate isomerase RpiB